jgi:hypothetical protein
MNRLLALLLTAVLLPASGCAVMHAQSLYGPPNGASQVSGLGPHIGGSATPLPAEHAAGVRLSVVDPRKVIYKAELAVVVGDAGDAVAATKLAAEKLGGYMQRMTTDAIIIRVPAERFDEALAAIDKLGIVTEKDITAQDVTEEYVDLRIRLKNARALLEKLQSLLEKAQNVKDALAVEGELTRVRTEIERLEGNLNSLTHRIAYATISVAFTEVLDAPEELRIHLPFWWLKTVGVGELLGF